MEVQRENEGGGHCPFPCSLSSLLSMNCRARAEGLARRLQTQIRQKDSSSGVEGTLLVESNGKVRLAPSSEGRAYSLDDHNLDAFKTNTAEMKNLRPIHVVTSEPTLHLCLPPQPDEMGEGAASPTEQEQDSDVYYDFDLVTPPDDYACTGESRMATREAIPEENEKPEKPESGCVTSVTSPIMFANGNFALPPINPPSPLEDCLSESNSRASDVDLEAIRQLLVSSKLRSLYSVSDTERPITVSDNAPDFVGVVRGRTKSVTEPSSNKSSSSPERSSSDEGELVVPVHEEEKTLVLSEEEVTCNSSYYLPPPSSYQIFSNQESGFDSGEMSTTSLKKQSKASKRRQKKKKSYSRTSSVSESSDSRESSLETQEREFPITSASEKSFVLEDPPRRNCLFNQNFHRSHSTECSQEEKLSKIFKTSNSIEECNYVVLPNARNNDPVLSDSREDLPRRKESLNSKSKSKKMAFLVYSSSIESVSSPEENTKSKTSDLHCSSDIQSSKLANHENKNKESADNYDTNEILIDENEIELNLLNEEKVLQEIDDAISILKRDGDDAVGKKLAKYEKHDAETLSLESNEGEKLLEQVASSYLGSAFGAQGGCQQFVPGSQRCELCEEEVPFLSFKNDFRDTTSDLTASEFTCPSFCNINSTSSELGNISTEIEMPKSKGRVKVKRASAETQSSSSLGGAELPERAATNAHSESSSEFLNLKFNEKSASPPKSEKCESFEAKDDSGSSFVTKDICVSPHEENPTLSNGNQLSKHTPLNENASLKNKSALSMLSSSDNNVNKLEHKSDKEPCENHTDSMVKESTDSSEQLSPKEDDNHSKNAPRPSTLSASYQQESKDDDNGVTPSASETMSSEACIDSHPLSPDETFHSPQRTWPWSRRRRLRNRIPPNSEKEKTESFSADSECNENLLGNKREERVDPLQNISPALSNLSDNNSVEDSHTKGPLSSVSIPEKLSPEQEVVPNIASNRGEIKSNCILPSANECSGEASSVSNKATSMTFDKSSPQQNEDEATENLLHEVESDGSEIKATAEPLPSECKQRGLLPADEALYSEEVNTDDRANNKDVENESNADETNTEKMSGEDDIIETLPENNDEKEPGDAEQNEDEDSEDEAIITGRFKNISKYKETVRRSSDDGLPPPPTEVILVDYNEPLESDSDEDTPESDKGIGLDLAVELDRLNLDEPTVQGPSDDSERSSEERETDVDRQLRIKRSSSLRCGKTPPGTPGRKKIVRFADCLGLDLADIRTFLDGVPNVPPSAFCDLQVEDDTAEGSGHHSLPSYGSYSAAASAAAAILQNQARRILTPMFQQPGALPDFFHRLREQKVMLENVSVGEDLSVKGVVRVINESYHKKVFIRYTFDQWKNYHEATATYVDGSCDGFSDRFSFLLWGSFLQSNGSLVFCVKYCMNDTQYWDNNRGSNYVLHCYSTPPLSVDPSSNSWLRTRLRFPKPSAPLPNMEIQPLDGRPQNHFSMHHQQQHGHDQHHYTQQQGGSSSFLDTPTTPGDPWISRFF